MPAGVFRYFMINFVAFSLVGSVPFSPARQAFDTKGPPWQPVPLDVCELLRKPSQHRGKTIQLRTILVENNNFRIDGGEPFLYGSGCLNNKTTVLVRWSEGSFANSSAKDSLQSIRTRTSNEHGISRASVLVEGYLTEDRGRKFGHLGWADLEFNIKDVLSAGPVEANAPWPEWFEKADRKAKAWLRSKTRTK